MDTALTATQSPAKTLDLRFRAEPVPWWNLFFGWIGMALGMQLPSLARTTVEVVPGDLVTVAAIANGDADFGFTTPPACATMGYRGVGWFDRPLENLRAVANFPHDDRLMWAVPAELGVRSIEELFEHPIRVAHAGSGGPVCFAVEKILEAYGMPRAELEARGWEFKEAEYLFGVVSLAIDGEADLVVHEGRKTPPWKRLLEAREMTFLPIREDVIEELVERYGFRRAILSKGMLDGAVTEDMATLDWSGWLLFTHANMDDELAYRIASIVVEQAYLFEWAFAGVDTEHSDLVCPIDPYAVCRDTGVPLHPGAERYYREHGYLE